ncbi:MFS transporter [Chloroflexota bacterium]
MFPKTKEKLFYGWVIAFAIIFISIIIGGTRFSFGVFFKPLAGEFDLTRATTSSLYSVYMIFCTLFSIVGGWALDRYGPRLVYLLIGIFIGLSLLLSSQTSSWWQLYLSYSLLLAIGTASMYPVLNATISRWFEKKRGLAMGIAGSGPILGQIIFSPLSAFLISLLSWRMAFLVMGLIALLVILPVSRLLRNDPAEIGVMPDGAKSKTSQQEDVGKKDGSLLTGLTLSQALRTSNFWIFSTAWVVTGFTTFLILIHVVPYATDTNVTAMQAATVMSVMGGIAIPSGILLGRISDNAGRKIPLIAIFLLRATALIGLIWARELWMFNLFAVAYGITMGANAPLLSSLSVDMFGKRSIGVIMGTLNATFAIGATIGPFVGGFVYDANNSYTLAFLIGAILCTMTALSIPLIKMEIKSEKLSKIAEIGFEN